jgi:hypothetical protein
MMEEWPQKHEQYRQQAAPDDPVVRFVDRTPALDGARDDAYTTVFAAPGVSLASDPLSMFVFMNAPISEAVSLTLFDGEQAGDHRATIRIVPGGEVSVVNGAGQSRLNWSRRSDQEVEIQIPYQSYRPQHDWLTAVEHGRYRVELGREGASDRRQARTVYFLSDAARIKRRLQGSVEGAIVNHAKILDQQGWLPYAIADKSRDRFDRLSFSGAYGHLIHTIAQYQLWKQGQRDWNMKQTVHAKLP